MSSRTTKYHPRSSECKAPWFDSLQIWYITSWTRKIKNDHPVEDVREQTVQDDFMLHSPCSSATHPLSDK
ncbi:hypothetical protein M8J77_020864 [Diaphorina citri]|nr:hypothetical protein M8J77_020864 [Diaphorina citri]